MVILEQNEQESGQYFEAPLPFLIRENVFVDWDHSMSGIEGMDELARRKSVHDEVAAITKLGMEGGLPWGEGFQRRLEIIRPTLGDMNVLAGMYRDTLAPNLRETIFLAQAVGLNIHIISGGPFQAIVPVANEIGIPTERVHANVLHFDADGCYEGYDQKSPLAHGRKDIYIENLRQEGVVAGPIAGVGDGLMDMKAVGAELKIGIGAHTARVEVEALADIFLLNPSFAAILPLIVGKAGIEHIIHHHPDMLHVLALGMRELEGAKFSNRAAGIKQAIVDIYNTAYFNGHKPVI